MTDDGRPVVVVGVDGSAGSDAALRYAVAEAHRRGGHVLAVTACDSPELAALLVVGHRGRGAFLSTAFGSVGTGCALHAPCPVTVVPAPRGGADDRGRPVTVDAAAPGTTSRGGTTP